MDLERDAPVVDDQVEAEEPAAALLCSGEPGDLGDVGVGAELQAQLDLLRSAEGVLAATGEAVALCPTYGDGKMAVAVGSAS